MVENLENITKYTKKKKNSLLESHIPEVSMANTVVQFFPVNFFFMNMQQCP